MGNGYSILVWDGWGQGLNRINPRFLTDGVDMYGNPQNWWPCDDTLSDADIVSIDKTWNLTNTFAHWEILQ